MAARRRGRAGDKVKMKNGFKDSIAWQKSMDFAIFIYKIVKQFPDQERYGLTSQITRAAISVSANIAEGYARASSKEFLHFLSISLGSLAEVENFIELAKRLGYISLVEYNKANEMNDEIRRIIKSTVTTIKRNMEN